MNGIINEDISSMIYKVRGKQVMLDSEISATKCHDYLYDKIVTHYDIGIPISVFNNFIIGGK
ncbi:MAG: hypothetical protein IJ565_02235 [Bacilli bacterium]|nr:hypothetical protein [Bacilli bacterium]